MRSPIAVSPPRRCRPFAEPHERQVYGNSPGHTPSREVPESTLVVGAPAIMATRSGVVMKRVVPDLVAAQVIAGQQPNVHVVCRQFPQCVELGRK